MTFWQHQSVVKCWQIKMKCFQWVLELKKIRSENNLRFQNKGNLWSICKYNWDTLGWPKLLGNDDIDLRIDINHTDTSCVPKNKDTTKRNETNRSDQLKEKLFIMQEIYHKPAIIFRFLYHYYFFSKFEFFIMTFVTCYGAMFLSIDILHNKWRLFFAILFFVFFLIFFFFTKASTYTLILYRHFLPIVNRGNKRLPRVFEQIKIMDFIQNVHRI